MILLTSLFGAPAVPRFSPWPFTYVKRGVSFITKDFPYTRSTGLMLAPAPGSSDIFAFLTRGITAVMSPVANLSAFSAPFLYPTPITAKSAMKSTPCSTDLTLEASWSVRAPRPAVNTGSTAPAAFVAPMAVSPALPARPAPLMTAPPTAAAATCAPCSIAKLAGVSFKPLYP